MHGSSFCLLAFPETAYGDLDFSFWPEPWYALLDLWNVMVQVFVLPALSWFGFLFPERWRADLRLPWFQFAILAASSGAFVLELGFSAAGHFSVQSIRSSFFACRSGPIMFSPLASRWTCVLLFLTAVFDKLRSASTGVLRQRSAGIGHRQWLVARPA